MSRLFFLALISIFLVHRTTAQEINQGYEGAKAKIDSLFNAENYHALLPLVEKQLRQIEKQRLYDSVYSYVHIIGRTVWKTSSAAQGAERAESLVTLTTKYDPDYHHLLTALTDLSWFYYETGNDSLCLKTDEHYVDVCLRQPSIEPELLARGYYNVGFDHLAIGDARTGTENFTKAIVLLSKDHDNHAGLLIKLNNALGSCLYREGNFRYARDAYYTAINLATSSAEEPYDKYSNIANGYGNLSLIYKDERNYVNAKNMLEKSIENRKLALAAAGAPHLKQQENDNVIKGYVNLASIYLGLGEFGKTEQLLALAKLEKDKLLEPTDPRRKLIHESFASLYVAQGKYEKAIENLLIYKAACLEHYGEMSFWTGFAAKRLGQAYTGLKDAPSAIASYSEAIKIFEGVGDEESSQDLAGTYVKRAESYLDLHSADAALSDIESALSIYDKTRDSSEMIFAECQLVKAKIRFDSGDAARAEALTREAIQLLEKHDHHTDQNDQVRYLNPFLPGAYHFLAKIILSESDGSSSQEAMSCIEKAAKGLANAQLSLQEDADLLELFASNDDIYQDGEELCEKLFRATGDAKYVEQMLRFGEENKTLLLRRRLNQFSSVLFADIPDSVVERELRLTNHLHAQSQSVKDVDVLLKTERELDACVQSIKADYPEYYDLRYKTDVATIQEIQSQLLSDDQNFIEFFLTAENMYALVVQPQKFQLVTLSRPETTEAIRSYNRALLERNEAAISTSAYLLYQLLFQPIEGYLVGKQLIIVPDNELFQINFEALRSQPGNVRSSLIYDYVISYSLSATTSVQFSQLRKGNSGKGLLALAPGFSDSQKTGFTASNHEIDNRFLSYLQQPFAVHTVEKIISIIPGLSFTDRNATESNFRSNAGKFGVIHFGTHTEINNTSPLMSRLVLCYSGTDTTEADDGYLHAYEIYEMDLRAELAVLSACETGAGQPDNSEGILSLAHSFAYAGCPSVVMSAWKIDEKTSSEIIESFYGHLAAGMAKNEALRAAKLDFLARHPGELSSPYYWAGLVLIGDVHPLSSASDHRWLWIMSALLVCGILVLLYRRYRKARKAQA